MAVESAADYIEAKPAWKEGLTILRSTIMEFSFEETIKWNAPVYMAFGRNLVGLSAFKNHFGIWFFEGVALEDPARVLENAQTGKTKYMRQWKFSKTEEIDTELLRTYLKETLNKASRGKPEFNTSENKKENKVPDELAQALESSEELKKMFSAFPPYKQQEFADYITEAKREETRKKRLIKVSELILKGEGLNDRYR